MSGPGPNQHHIPQFLQRSFGVKPKGKAPKEIWRYRQGEAPELRLISKTAAEENFYSPPAKAGEKTLDGKISDAEDILAKSYHVVRVLPIGASVDAAVAADLVTHLAPRAAHLRLSMATGFHRIAARARDLFSDPKNLEQMLGLHEDEPTELFREKLRENLGDALHQIEAAGLPSPVLERVAFYVAKENIDATVEQTVSPFGSMLNQLATGSPDIARDGHNRALNDLADGPNVRRDLLATFNWTVEAAPPDGAILPDCVALAYGPDEPALPLMFVGKDMRAVVMPSTKDRLLIGRRPEAPPLPLADFNQDAASCSQDFFLAHADCPAFTALAPLIGTRSAAYFDDATRAAFDAVLPASAVGEDVAEAEPLPAHLPNESDLQFSYTVRLSDFGDNELAQKVGEAAASIVRSLGRWLPLSRLDGIEFAIDFPAALRGVDRGRADLAPIEAVHSGEVGCVGRMVTVFRDDKPKAWLVFNANVAGCLLSDEKEALEPALMMLVHQLTLVAMMELVDRALPGAFDGPIEDEFQAGLYSQVRDSLTGYTAARMSAGFGDVTEVEEYHREALVDALGAFRSDVERERLAYRYHADLDKFLQVALPAVRRILNVASDLLGVCAGADRPVFDDAGALHDALQRTNLAKWLPNFARDLGLVEIHRELMTAEQRKIKASKL